MKKVNSNTTPEGLCKKRNHKYLKYFPFYMLSVIPLQGLYLISDFIYFMSYHLIKYRRNVVRTNLKNSFPDKTETEIVDIEKKFYKHFCDVAVESIKALTISNKQISKRFRVKNKELIEGLFKQKKNIILYAAHYGNWEWLSFLPLYIPYQSLTFYQKLSNDYFDELMQIIRNRHGAWCVESHQGYKTLVRLKNENAITVTGIIGDQSPGKQSSKYWVNFLNQQTAFLVGADKIAKKLNQTVVYVSFQKLKRGVYEIAFESFGDEHNKSEDIIDKYAAALERSIINAPELWLWSHRRWKLTRPYNIT